MVLLKQIFVKDVSATIYRRHFLFRHAILWIYIFVQSDANFLFYVDFAFFAYSHQSGVSLVCIGSQTSCFVLQTMINKSLFDLYLFTVMFVPFRLCGKYNLQR